MKFSFIETPTFTRKIVRLMNDSEYADLQGKLLERPESGSVIKGGRGIRKVRYRAKGHGSSGGVRVIYFWFVARDIIVMLDVYAKNEKSDLSQTEIAELAKIGEQMSKDHE